MFEEIWSLFGRLSDRLLIAAPNWWFCPSWFSAVTHLAIYCFERGVLTLVI
jgi:hypothetical protein